MDSSLIRFSCKAGEKVSTNGCLLYPEVSSR